MWAIDIMEEDQVKTSHDLPMLYGYQARNVDFNVPKLKHILKKSDEFDGTWPIIMKKKQFTFQFHISIS